MSESSQSIFINRKYMCDLNRKVRRWQKRSRELNVKKLLRKKNKVLLKKCGRHYWKAPTILSPVSSARLLQLGYPERNMLVSCLFSPQWPMIGKTTQRICFLFRKSNFIFHLCNTKQVIRMAFQTHLLRGCPQSHYPVFQSDLEPRELLQLFSLRDPAELPIEGI